MRQVTAAVIVEDGCLLLTRRPTGDHLAGLCELPGGKIEAGETPRDCVERELREELDMASTGGNVAARTIYEYEHGSFEILAIETTRRSDFELRVHDRYAWVRWDDLDEYILLPADLRLLTQLRGRPTSEGDGTRSGCDPRPAPGGMPPK